jgi:hypothetical protein
MECWFESSWTTIFTIVIPFLLIATMADQVSSSKINSFKITKRISTGYMVFLCIACVAGISSNKVGMYLGLPSGAFYLLPIVFTMLRLITFSLDKIANSEFGNKRNGLGSRPIS